MVGDKPAKSGPDVTPAPEPIDRRPVLYAERVNDGALALYRHRRNTAGGWNMEHCCTLFHPDCVAEALRDGWSAATPNGEAMHRVVLVSDVQAHTRAMFERAVG